MSRDTNGEILSDSDTEWGDMAMAERRAELSAQLAALVGKGEGKYAGFAEDVRLRRG